MTRLSVNINKFATLRNARGANNPDVIKAAMDCERFGAQGITVHPRPDERHIRRADVIRLREAVTTEFNIEGYPDERFLKLLYEVKPTQATLVPDSPEVLTSNAGWDTIKHSNFLKRVVGEIQNKGIRVSLFVDPSVKMVAGAAATKTDRIELYTEPYAANFLKDPHQAVASFVLAAQAGRDLGLGLNAGHDLDLDNLKFLAQSIPDLDEVSIGHALICDSLYLGLENAIQLYLRQLK